jgi:hypothetical protein
MSVAQFSPVLRDRIIQIFSDSSNKVDLANFGSKTRKQLFKAAPTTKDFRSRFESADYHNASLTVDGISALTAKLITTVEDESSKKLVENLFNNTNFFFNFSDYVEQQQSSQGRQGAFIEYGAGDIRIENVPQKSLRDYFVTYINENLSGVPQQVKDTLAKNVQSGHLAGVLFLKLKTALGVKTSVSTSVESGYRDFTVSMEGLEDANALKALDSIMKAIIDADYLTSNLVSNSQVFIDATKSVLGNNPRLYTELQFEEDNAASGRLLNKVGTQLNALIKAASAAEQSSANDAIKGLVKSLQPVADVILQRVEELKEPLSKQGLYNQIKNNALYLTQQLINAPGSVTLVQGIGKNIANVIKTGKSLPASTTKIRPKPIKQKHKEVLDISKTTKEFIKSAEKLKTAIKNTRAKTVQVRAQNTPASTVNLPKLLMFINQHLQDVISANMGDGSRRDVLNYRTGRFAGSVKVENLSESRAGMITAFYSYMKNPYATFSQGGRQERPKTRDPKLLIAASIREIAAQQVANQLRAVVV